MFKELMYYVAPLSKFSDSISGEFETIGTYALSRATLVPLPTARAPIIHNLNSGAIQTKALRSVNISFEVGRKKRLAILAPLRA
jgi:hypothetical protein